MQGLKFVVAALIAAVVVGTVCYSIDTYINTPSVEQTK
ncbi:Uncharacterised protein [Escherichia coli]|nr:Uncharacterised protein [Escherichia coli]VVZ34086.1 Uncharacterised protein [Escherichia coli]VWN20885.1 Uncharacterised protein [Escherichia coli]